MSSERHIEAADIFKYTGGTLTINDYIEINEVETELNKNYIVTIKQYNKDSLGIE